MLEFRPVIKQFSAIICCNLLTLSFGLIGGWATINQNDLEKESSTFATGPLTKDEIKYIVSLDKFGGLIGNFAIFPLMRFIGVKRTIHSLGLVLIISSLLIICAQNVFYLYVSRILSGFTGGALVVGIPSLIVDISYDNVRGALNSLFDPSNNFGIIASFSLGIYLNASDQAKVQLIVPIIFMIVMFLFPESPEFWACKNKTKKAIKSSTFYKGPQNVEVEKGTSHTDDDVAELDSKLRLNDFLTPHARRAFFISFTPLALSFISGASVILNYITTIFEETLTEKDSLLYKKSSVLVSIVQITANLVMLTIIERFNRRTLYILSSLLTTASYILFGVYCWFWFKEPAFEWMPPFCFGCIIFFSNMGLLPIPYIITTEVFPKKIRQPCLSLALSCMWIIQFGLDLVMPRFFENSTLLTIGLFTLAIVCMLNALFGICCIPETRGKSFEEITKMLSK